jgi:LEA14-like dessication related protein
MGISPMKLFTRHIYLTEILLVVLLFSPFCCVHAEEESQIELPKVIISSFEPDIDFLKLFPEYQRTAIKITFKISHPYTEKITIERLEYKIYANGILIEERSNKPEEVLMKGKEIISPGEIKTIEIIPEVDFSKIDEKTKNFILEKKVKWNVTGAIYFNTSKGIIGASIQGITTDYPSGKEFGIIIYIKDKNWNSIAQAKVTLTSKFFTLNKLSDEEGKAIFLNLPYPNYTFTLKVSKEGFFPYKKYIEVSEPRPPTGEIVELYSMGKLTIEVRDPAGMPISYANITFLSKDVGNFTKITNTSGMAEFEIPRTNYTLSVVKKGYVPYEEVLDISKSSIESKVIRLKHELTWWEQYWPYLIIGVIAVCIIVPVVLRQKGNITSLTE